MEVIKSNHFTVGYWCSIGIVRLKLEILEFTFGTKVAVKYGNERDYSRNNAMATDTLGP